MLTVNDHGVTIALQSGAPMPSRLRSVVVVAVIIAVTGGLMALSLIPTMLGAFIIVMALVGSYAWHYFAQSSDPPLLFGGDLSLKPYEFSHQAQGRTVNYRLQPTDTVHLLPMDSPINKSQPMALSIHRGDGKVLYQISGFSDAKHQQIAQAVLQGKSVQAQAKAIRLKSTV